MLRSARVKRLEEALGVLQEPLRVRLAPWVREMLDRAAEAKREAQEESA